MNCSNGTRKFNLASAVSRPWSIIRPFHENWNLLITTLISRFLSSCLGKLFFSMCKKLTLPRSRNIHETWNLREMSKKAYHIRQIKMNLLVPQFSNLIRIDQIYQIYYIFAKISQILKKFVKTWIRSLIWKFLKTSAPVQVFFHTCSEKFPGGFSINKTSAKNGLTVYRRNYFEKT